MIVYTISYRLSMAPEVSSRASLKKHTRSYCQTYFSVILNEVKDLKLLQCQDSSLRSESQNTDA